MKLENAAVTAVNLSTSQGLSATITLTIQNPDDATLAALLALVNQPITGVLTPTPAV